MARQKVPEGEVNPVDPYFKTPGIPVCTVSEKRKFLAILDHLIAKNEFWIEELVGDGQFADHTDYERNSLRREWLKCAAFTWLHKVIESQHPVEHRKMIDDGTAGIS